MGKYSTEERFVTFAGMDVHARSIAVSAVDVETGETFSGRFAGPGMESELAGWLERLPQPVYCAYESGCTGFGLARALRSLGIACDVIAVSTLPRSQRDRKQKCDRLDARAIRRGIANPDPGYSVVWVPDERTEAERDLCRAHRVAVDTCKRARQRLSMFLLRHGHVWDERTRTGRLKKAGSGSSYPGLAELFQNSPLTRRWACGGLPPCGCAQPQGGSPLLVVRGYGSQGVQHIASHLY